MRNFQTNLQGQFFRAVMCCTQVKIPNFILIHNREQNFYIFSESLCYIRISYVHPFKIILKFLSLHPFTYVDTFK